MEAASAELQKRMEAAAEAAEIAKRGMKESAKEAKVKSAATKSAAKAADSVSSAGTSSTDTVVSTTAFLLRAPTSTSSVVSVSRRSGYTLIIIML